MATFPQDEYQEEFGSKLYDKEGALEWESKGIANRGTSLNCILINYRLKRGLKMHRMPFLWVLRNCPEQKHAWAGVNLYVSPCALLEEFERVLN